MCTAFISQKFDRRQRRLGLLYKIPNPFTSLEQYQQFTHEDLRSMSRALLKRELAKIRLRLLYDDDPPSWLLKRFDIIREALR